MPKKTSGGLETVPLVLTESQVARLTALTALRQTDHNKVSRSAVAREVVELGLRAIFDRHVSTSVASTQTQGGEGAA